VSNEAVSNEERRARRSATRAVLGAWLYDHIGRLSGLLLGALALVGLLFLAVIGYGPAIGLLVVIVIGILLIAVGGRMRGGR
jgi:hypothetical protein